ncbi:MAG: ATP-binding cassette domain-containing protein [bacterium]|nr:ATP-binding cassette domain-containing protein [bacterium]
MPNETSPRVSIERLRYRYPQSDWRFETSEFHARAGETIAIIGPNGSGKSTFLKLIAGVLPCGDPIMLDGQRIDRSRRRETARTLGYLPQDPHSEYDYRALEIVSLGRYPYTGPGGFFDEHDCRVLDDVMAKTEIETLRDRRMSQLSGGERRRVFLASVLAQEPSVLLLDEPTNALDPHHQIRFFNILIEQAKQGLTVIVVTHDLNLASHFCERILLMHQGSVIADGRADEVITEARIAQAYGDGILLARHPQTGRPVVFPKQDAEAS